MRGQYPGVFDYKLAKFPEVDNFDYCANASLGSIILIVTFHDPGCDCERCGKIKAARGDSLARGEALGAQPLWGPVIQ